MAVDPNGGSWAINENATPSREVQYISKKVGDQIDIYHPIPQNLTIKYIDKIDENNEKLIGTQDVETEFKGWKKDGEFIQGAGSENQKYVYTFGNKSEKIIADYGVNNTFLLDENDPGFGDTNKKEGYTLEGWKKEDGTIIRNLDEAYTPTYKVDSKGNVTETLIAKWEENTYSIAFNNNGGTGTMSNITGVKFTESKILTKNTFTRSGYTFKGWSLTKGGAKKYNDEATVSRLSSTQNATVTLYAVWADETGPVITANNSITYGDTLSIRIQDVGGIAAWQVSTSSTEPTTGWTTITQNTTDTTVTKTGLNAGTQYIWVKDTSGNVSSQPVTVIKKKITQPNATTGLKYAGIEQTGVAATTDFTVTDGKMTNAGDYTATISLKDKTNTTWADGTTADKTIPWSIAKKDITVTWGATTSWVYDGKEHAPTVTTPVDGVNGEKINIVVSGAKTNKGSYTATASIDSVTGGQAKKENYNITEASREKAFTISAQASTTTVEITGTNTFGNKLTANYETNGDGDVEIQWWHSDSSTATTGTPISGATSKDYIVGTGLVGQYIGVTITVKAGENYGASSANDITDSAKNTTAQVAAKKITAPTASNKTYTGVEQTGVAEAAGYTVTDGAKINAGNYTATVTLTDKTNTVWADTNNTTNKTISWSIAKKQVAVQIHSYIMDQTKVQH